MNDRSVEGRVEHDFEFEKRKKEDTRSHPGRGKCCFSSTWWLATTAISEAR